MREEKEKKEKNNKTNQSKQIKKGNNKRIEISRERLHRTKYD